jgi:hypothetical protein
MKHWVTHFGVVFVALLYIPLNLVVSAILYTHWHPDRHGTDPRSGDTYVILGAPRAWWLMQLLLPPVLFLFWWFARSRRE